MLAAAAAPLRVRPRCDASVEARQLAIQGRLDLLAEGGLGGGGRLEEGGHLLGREALFGEGGGGTGGGTGGHLVGDAPRRVSFRTRADWEEGEDGEKGSEGEDGEEGEEGRERDSRGERAHLGLTV